MNKKFFEYCNEYAMMFRPKQQLDLEIADRAGGKI